MNATERLAKLLYEMFYQNHKSYPWPPSAANKWRAKAILIFKELEPV